MLTKRNQLFLEHYLQVWNATRAARLAGFALPDKQGPRLLKKPEIREAIQARMNELQMPTNEILARLSQQASANVIDFVIQKNEGFGLNWPELEKRGHLVKSITMTKTGPRLELHDGQSALDKLARALGLYIEKQEITKKNVKVELYMPERDADE